ncbi:MAG TPA: hypothetical protein VLH56_08855 [Dissulfurispiraceae bacterium]|nr:hypothetical protein [Dissulfurispiraceae bacterium]
MSIAIYPKDRSCYIKTMSNGPLAEWFEKKYLEWQLKEGRASLTAFAKYIGISKGYLGNILSGLSKSVSMPTAIQISERLRDDSLLDLLGYPRQAPDDAQEEALLGSLPPELAGNLRSALTEINRIYAERGVAADSPEAVSIAAEVLGRFGFIVKVSE